MSRLLLIVAVLALAVPMGASARTGPVDGPVDEPQGEVDAEGLELVRHFSYGEPDASGTAPFFSSGTDLAFDGDIVYAAQQADGGIPEQQGGIHIIDVADPDDPQHLGLVPCEAYQNDVAVVRSGLVALGYHGLNGDCFGLEEEGQRGLALFDVSDAEAPALVGSSPNIAPKRGGLSGGTHTITVHPSGDFIYASPGGLPTNGGGGNPMSILDVSDETQVTIAGEFISNGIGCHDFSFFDRSEDSLPSPLGEDLGVCVGFGETQIWDVSDPVAPVVISRITNPLVTFHHSGVVSDDGRFLVIGDEAFGAHDCEGGPTGALFMYDITTPEAPVPQSYFGIDRAHGDAPLSSNRVDWCTAHLYNFIPGTMIMVVSWYSGGITVIDWSDPTAPREIGHYRMDGEYAEGEVSNYWSAYFHGGRVYANDRVRGFDALRFTGDLEGLGDGGDAATAAVAAMPSSARPGWHSGRLHDVPTPQQAAWLATRPAPDLTSPSLVCVLR